MAICQFECRSCGRIFWMKAAEKEGQPISLPPCKTCSSVNVERIFPRPRVTDQHEKKLGNRNI